MNDRTDAQEWKGAPLAAHCHSVDEVLSSLDVSSSAGLTEEEASRRLERYGANTVRSRRKIRAITILLHQFASPVVYLLGGAAALAFYFSEWKEGSAILVVLALNTLIGYLTEAKAAHSIEALRALGTRSARVRRAGRILILPAEQLVPGDIVLVEGGDSISADLRVIESASLGVDESTLTGESVAIQKSVEPVHAEARVADRSSMVFKGTSIVQGSGLGVVVATGVQTELGRISQLVEEAAPERTPLEKGLAVLAGQLVWITLLIALLIVGVGLFQGHDMLLMVTTAIALAVAAIPEGLPVVATLALARGMWRMARQNALVERLSAVETLGATTLILTDKTGTLTENRMSVSLIEVPSNLVDFSQGQRSTHEDLLVLGLLEVAVLCNDASLGGEEADDSGDPMEQALLYAGQSAGIHRARLLDRRPQVRKHAFDTATRMMATVHKREGEHFFAIKGAPEAILNNASMLREAHGDVALAADVRTDWMRRIDEMGRRGLRVLAFGEKFCARPDTPPFEDLTFLGVVGLEDPPRADVPGAILACREAGVRVAMVTGDHAVTALAIGRHIGLGDTGYGVVEGTELVGLGGEAESSLLKADIFARVNPAEKLALVRAYQRSGEVVAMTGDGVNDAPALRQADIGVAMGLRGTDVAREAAAMVLLDDAFPTIAKAIREGRIIFANIRKFAAFLLSCNLSEVLIVALAVLLALPLPLLPIQILYLNLITDVFPAFALAVGEGESDAMQRPPRAPGEAILGRNQWTLIIAHGLVLTAATFGAMLLSIYCLNLDAISLVTVTFLTLAFAQLLHVFNMRHAASELLVNEITRNPWIWAALTLCAALLAIPPYVPVLADVLSLVAPTPKMWLVILGMSIAPVLLIQTITISIRWIGQRTGT